MCGCIHGCTLSELRDALVAKLNVLSEPCMCAECAVSGWKTLSPPLHEDCKIYLFNFCIDPVGNNHSFTDGRLYDCNVVHIQKWPIHRRSSCFLFQIEF